MKLLEIGSLRRLKITPSQRSLWVTNLNSAQNSDDYKLCCLMAAKLAENAFLFLIYVNCTCVLGPDWMALDSHPLEGRDAVCIMHSLSMLWFPWVLVGWLWWGRWRRTLFEVWNCDYQASLWDRRGTSPPVGTGWHWKWFNPTQCQIVPFGSPVSSSLNCKGRLHIDFLLLWLRTHPLGSVSIPTSSTIFLSHFSPPG